jgi:hypothetical protein
MKVTSTLKTHLVVDDFFNEDELKLVWRELDYLTSPNRMFPPTDPHSGSAIQNGKPLKQNMVAPLMQLFNSPQYSDIFNSFGKIYNDEFIQIMDEMSNEFRYYSGSDHLNNRCFVSYYENEDYYKLHRDNAILTFLYWVNKEPKQFKGGDLTLPEIGVDVEYKNNRLVIFPSHLLHSVSSIEMIGDNEPFSGYGRYCISYFLYLRERQ